MRLIIKIIVIAVVILILYLVFGRKSSIWTEEVKVSKDVIIPIEFKYSRRLYISGGHGLGWGGGHEKNKIKFTYKNVNYIDNTTGTPVVIKYYKETFYIVYFDRTDMNKILFRFFKSTNKGKFEEVNPKFFPKEIAIQNRWFKGYNNSEESLNGLDSKKMAGTLTSKIWNRLETGSYYYEKKPVTINFIKDYKEKYITNRQEKK